MGVAERVVSWDASISLRADTDTRAERSPEKAGIDVISSRMTKRYRFIAFLLLIEVKMDSDSFFAVREVEETLQRTIPRQVLGRSDMDTAPLVHQPDAVRNLQGQLQVVGGQEDRLAGLV